MINLDWLNRQHRIASPEDVAFWNHAVRDMPPTGGHGADGTIIPCSCGPHSLNSMRLFVETEQPESLLEIGFNVGHSAAVWLALGVAHLRSVDIRGTHEVYSAAHILENRHDGLFEFVQADSSKLESSNPQFGHAFIDGDHSESGILADIATCRRLGIKVMLFDDAFPEFGDTLKAVEKSGLWVKWWAGNQICCHDIDRSKWAPS